LPSDGSPKGKAFLGGGALVVGAGGVVAWGAADGGGALALASAVVATVVAGTVFLVVGDAREGACVPPVPEPDPDDE
jgi:hypothetical protein